MALDKMSEANAPICKYCYPLIVGAAASCELHAEITTLRAQLEEARAKAIEECILALKKERRTKVCGPENATQAELRAWDKCRYDTLKSAEHTIRSLLHGSTK